MLVCLITWFLNFQNEKLHLELEFELSLCQLPNWLFHIPNTRTKKQAIQEYTRIVF